MIIASAPNAITCFIHEIDDMLYMLEGNTRAPTQFDKSGIDPTIKTGLYNKLEEHEVQVVQQHAAKISYKILETDGPEGLMIPHKYSSHSNASIKIFKQFEIMWCSYLSSNKVLCPCVKWRKWIADGYSHPHTKQVLRQVTSRKRW